MNNKPLGRAKGQIKTNAKEQMAEIAEKPENIKKLFNAESVKYASYIFAVAISFINIRKFNYSNLLPFQFSCGICLIIFIID